MRQRLLLTMFLVAGLSSWQPASARQPVDTLFSIGELGMSLLRLDPAAEFALPGAEGLTPSAVSEAHAFEARRRAAEQALETLLAEQGVYGEGLAEAHGELASLHLEQGDFPQAAGLYRQAWHLSRVNSGLYDERQLSYLNALIESLIALEQWDEVHDLHQLSFLIASRVYPPDDLRYLVAAEFYAAWKWEAITGNYLTGGSRSVFETAQQLSAFYEEVIDRAEHAQARHTSGLVKLVAGKARTDLSIVRALLSSHHYARFLGPGSYIPETECFAVEADPEGYTRRCRQVQLSLFNLDETAPSGVHFAAGRYLRQVDTSVERLQRLRAAADRLSMEEARWIDGLIDTLQRESIALSHRRPGN